MHKIISPKGSIALIFILSGFITFSPIQLNAEDKIQKTTAPDDTTIKEPATGLAAPFSELKDTNPKLCSALNQLVSAYKTVGIEGARRFAAESDILIKDDLVQVVIELDKNPDLGTLDEKIAFLRREILMVGGKIEFRYKDSIQAQIPIEVLEKVASWPEVRVIRKPFKPVPMTDVEVSGEKR